MKEWEQAAAVYEAALARDNSRADWYARLAQVRAKLKQWEQAAAAYEAALARDDSRADWYARLARVRADMKQWEQAAAAYEAALARDDSRADWYTRLAQVRAKLNQWEQAAAAYEAALARDDSRADWYTRLAQVRAKLNQWEQAAAAHEAALARMSSLDKLRSALIPALREKFCWKGGVTILNRQPHIYMSSSPSEIVTCKLGSHFTVQVLCKYGEASGSRALSHRAGTAGEAIVYREVLQPLSVVKPTFFGSHLDRTSGKTWLFLEYLERGECLTKVSKSKGAMPAAAGWLGDFHARAEERLENGLRPAIGRHSRDYYRNWARQTLLFAEPLREQYPWLETACFKFENAIETLEHAPATIVHGEFYPRNILLVDEIVVPVDWESAMIGAGEIDLATLIEGWDPDMVETCKAAYVSARWPDGAPSSFVPALQAARFYWTLRRLGDRPEKTLDKSMAPYFEKLSQLANQYLQGT